MGKYVALVPFPAMGLCLARLADQDPISRTRIKSIASPVHRDNIKVVVGQEVVGTAVPEPTAREELVSAHSVLLDTIKARQGLLAVLPAIQEATVREELVSARSVLLDIIKAPQGLLAVLPAILVAMLLAMPRPLVLLALSGGHSRRRDRRAASFALLGRTATTPAALCAPAAHPGRISRRKKVWTV